MGFELIEEAQSATELQSRMLDVFDVIDRLDQVFAIIQNSATPDEKEELTAQAIEYAAFLTDVTTTRLSLSDNQVWANVEAIQMFCALIEAIWI